MPFFKTTFADGTSDNLEIKLADQDAFLKDMEMNGVQVAPARKYKTIFADNSEDELFIAESDNDAFIQDMQASGVKLEPIMPKDLPDSGNFDFTAVSDIFREGAGEMWRTAKPFFQGVGSESINLFGSVAAGTPEKQYESEADLYRKRILDLENRLPSARGRKASMSRLPSEIVAEERSGKLPEETEESLAIRRQIEEYKIKAEKAIQEANYHRDIRESMEKASQTGWFEPPRHQTTAEALTRMVGGGVPALTTAYAMAPLSPSAGALFLGHVQGLGQYFEARKNGMSVDEANRAYNIEALLASQIEQIPLDRVMKLKGGVIKRFIQQGTTEGLEEVLDQYKSNLIAKGMWDPDKKLSEGLLESGFVGAVLGGAAGAIMGGPADAPSQPSSVTPEALTRPKATEMLPTEDANIITPSENTSVYPEMIKAQQAIEAQIVTLPLPLEQRMQIWDQVQNAKTLEEAQAIIDAVKPKQQPQEVTDAGAIRSDEGQVLESRDATAEGQGEGGQNIQQPTSGESFATGTQRDVETQSAEVDAETKARAIRDKDVADKLNVSSLADKVARNLDITFEEIGESSPVKEGGVKRSEVDRWLKNQGYKKQRKKYTTEAKVARKEGAGKSIIGDDPIKRHVLDNGGIRMFKVDRNLGENVKPEQSENLTIPLAFRAKKGRGLPIDEMLSELIRAGLAPDTWSHDDLRQYLIRTKDTTAGENTRWDDMRAGEEAWINKESELIDGLSLKEGDVVKIKGKSATVTEGDTGLSIQGDGIDINIPYEAEQQQAVVRIDKGSLKQAPTEAVADEVEEEIVEEPEAKLPEAGVGAARAEGPEFFKGTGLSHAYTEEMRKRLGLTAFTARQKVKDAQLWKEVSNLYEDNPNVGKDLIEAFQQDPKRIATDKELVTLLVEAQAAELDISEARESRNEEKIDAADARLDAVYEVIERTGSETGAALRARRFLLDEELSVDRMKRKIKKLNKGRTLTAEEKRSQDEYIEKLHKDIQQAKQDFDEQLKINAELQTEVDANEILANYSATWDEMIEDLFKEANAKKSYKETLMDTAKKLEADYDEYMRTHGGQLSMNPFADIGRMVALGKLGASYMIQFGVKFSDWVVEMKKRLGDIFTSDQWKELYDVSLKEYNQQRIEQAKTAAKEREVKQKVVIKAEPVKKTKTGGVVKVKKEAIQEVLPGEIGEMAEEESSVTIKQLYKQQAMDGVEDPKEAAQNVYEIVKESMPDITLEDVMIEFSDYGKMKEPRKDRVSKVLASLRRQTQLLLSIKRVADKLAPLRTGAQRGKPDTNIRELDRQLKKAMKESGIESIDKAKELATPLDAIRRRLNNEIEDMDNAINITKERITKDKTNIKLTEDLQRLKEKRDAKKKQYDEVFPPEPLSYEEQLSKLIAEAQRTLAASRLRLDAARKGNFKKPIDGSKPWNKVLSDLKNEIEANRKEVQRLRDLSKPKKTGEQIAIERKLSALNRTIKEYERRVAEKDWKPKRRQDLDFSKNEAVLNTMVKLEVARARWREFYSQEKYKAMSRTEKNKFLASAFYEAFRGIMSGDASFLLNQGYMTLWTHPIIWGKVFKRGIGALSKKETVRLAAELANDPLNSIYKIADLALIKVSESGDVKETDDFNLELLRRIPGWGKYIIDPSSRSFAISGNEARVLLFKSFLNKDARGRAILKHQDAGKLSDGDKAYIKRVAKEVNTFTGKGPVDGRLKAGLSIIGNAPAFLKSLFDVTVGMPIWRPLADGDKKLAAVAALDYLKFYGFTTALLAILKGLLPEDKEPSFDPRSVKFAKIPLPGGFSVSAYGPITPVLNQLAKLVSGQIVDAEGNVENLRSFALPFASEEQKRKPVSAMRDQVTDIQNFLRGRAHPAINGLIGLLRGTDYFGKPQGVLTSLVQSILPLTGSGAWEAGEQGYDASGWTSAIASALMVGPLQYFGAKVNTDWTSFQSKVSSAKSSIRVYRSMSPARREATLRDLTREYDKAYESYNKHKDNLTKAQIEAFKKLRDDYEEVTNRNLYPR